MAQSFYHAAPIPSRGPDARSRWPGGLASAISPLDRPNTERPRPALPAQFDPQNLGDPFRPLSKPTLGQVGLHALRLVFSVSLYN